MRRLAPWYVGERGQDVGAVPIITQLRDRAKTLVR
jgi:hypothetical protein